MSGAALSLALYANISHLQKLVESQANNFDRVASTTTTALVATAAAGKYCIEPIFMSSTLPISFNAFELEDIDTCVSCIESVTKSWKSWFLFLVNNS